MADYHTEFSCIFDVGLAENAEAALAIRTALAAELADADERDVGFELEADPAHSPGALWSLAWLDCEHWLASGLDPARDADAAIVQSAEIDGE